VFVLPPVRDADMPSVYAAADALVLPSRGEGWGRPHVEAMSMGGELRLPHQGFGPYRQTLSATCLNAHARVSLYTLHPTQCSFCPTPQTLNPNPNLLNLNPNPKSKT
jgi:hypothetical protein